MTIDVTTDLLPADQGTAGSTLAGYPGIESATAARALTSAAGWIRSHADAVRNDADSLHQRARSYDLEQRAAAKGRAGVPSLLAELANNRGMSWADIARLTKVSVSAVRKWRSEGSASAETRLRLARLAAFLDLLGEYAIEDPVQWMEMRMPLPPGYPVTPMRLYQVDASTPLLDYASGRRTAEQVLDEVIPQWRDDRSAFEVYEDFDGGKAIRARQTG